MCEGAITDANSICHAYEQLIPILQEKYEKNKQVPHPKTPLTSWTRENLIAEVKCNRKKLAKVKVAIVKDSVVLSAETSEGLSAVMEQQSAHNNELMHLFWQEQSKALSKNPKGMRWHPMLIRFAIYLQYQSPRAYQALKDSGVLRLPNKSTLRDYTNVIQPKTGFQPEVFEVQCNNYLKSNTFFSILQ